MPPVTPEYLARRRAAILAAAARCFAANGFHATSMPDVCAEAGMSAGGVYRYFDSKETLIAELAELELAPVYDVLRAAADAEPLLRPAEVIDLVHRTVLADNPSSLLLQVWAEAVHNPAVHDSVRRRTAGILDILSSFTRRWMPGCSEDAALSAARALMAVSMGTFVLQNVMEASAERTATHTLLESLDGVVRAELQNE
ncbi:TetR/AcrR family transcriptional regulator [Kutzneria sp. CA-103260]|uniref:TetR/AcrR family transcriptional regulator n=1 Tax=Kutzneria sp. CA-103260 TaxID=2802641 RepID=UPI001BADCB5B|nr:TetR/AcrR family transcriptional regulator [Kutzneria sp. CA-103260]QUQ64686.1 HTH-type transcriptional regulator BetI [Kutzneria sp. CA-103260]